MMRDSVKNADGRDSKDGCLCGIKNLLFVKIHKKVTRKTVDINYKMWYNLK